MPQHYSTIPNRGRSPSDNVWRDLLTQGPTREAAGMAPAGPRREPSAMDNLGARLLEIRGNRGRHMQLGMLAGAPAWYDVTGVNPNAWAALQQGRYYNQLGQRQGAETDMIRARMEAGLPEAEVAGALGRATRPIPESAQLGRQQMEMAPIGPEGNLSPFGMMIRQLMEGEAALRSSGHTVPIGDIKPNIERALQRYIALDMIDFDDPNHQYGLDILRNRFGINVKRPKSRGSMLMERLRQAGRGDTSRLPGPSRGSLLQRATLP